MIFRNNNKITNIYRGTLKISNVYRGGILVYTGEKTYDGLTFEALEPSTILYTPSTVSTAQYSYDTVNWETADNVTLNLNTGDKVFFKGTITGNQTNSNYAKFTMTGKVSASGSIMSLQAGNPEDNTLNYNYEFYRMFNDCTSLVTSPVLPATTMAEHCYRNLFQGCSNLTSAPTLPATSLANYCYMNMFFNCSKLTTPPSLPATTLAEGCYQSLFYGCSSLTKAPALPATTLAPICYKHLFQGCTSLTTAPVLNAETLVSGCYTSMFYGCSKLNYIKALFTTTPSAEYTSNWVSGVASTGTFVKNKNATWDVTGNNGTPEGWTVQIEEEWEGLTFNALEPSTILYTPSTVSTAQYSYDTVNWETADNVTLNLNTGDKVYFKGNIVGVQWIDNYAHFTIAGNVSASGSIMSMQNGNPEDKTLNYNYEFYSLFALCTSLVSTPELPATTLIGNCYESMFDGCTSLVSAPELPATTLAYFCYAVMFQNCSKLVNSPTLPATTLEEGCYQQMFSGCSKLNYIKAMFTDSPSLDYTSDWVNGVAPTGTFVKNKDATWNVTGVTGIDGIPEGWTVETA